MTHPVFDLHCGSTPLLVSLPHVGTHVPEALQSRYVARALAVEDTDWHLDRLYGFVRELGASLIVPRHSRFVIDLNRPPENTPMYAGANNTELCPTRFFTGDPLYREGMAPDAQAIDLRRKTYWQPYHDALRAEMDRIQAQHGHAILFDGHSIRSRLPWLFEGTLPDLNLGTASGASCAAELRSALQQVLQSQDSFSHVVDGRFKGGYITRAFGRPATGQHAVQLEMCWSTYMQEQAPYTIDPTLTARLEPVLRSLVQTMIAWRPNA
jgi:N-formylglutamate deformylase